jgi:hypothetical protein
MNHGREEIMGTASAKKRHRVESSSARKAPRKRKAPSTDTEGCLTKKVIDSAQEAAIQVGALVKTAADKITGAERRRTVAKPNAHR